MIAEPKQMNDAESWATWDEEHQGQGGGKGSSGSGKSFSELSKDQQSAIKGYTTSSQGVTTTLLGGTPDPDLVGSPGVWQGDIQDQINLMDKAIEESPPLDKGEYYRGINFVNAEYMRNSGQLDEGAKFQYQTFMSVTKDFELAKEDFGFVGKHGTDREQFHVIKMDIPEGIKGISLNEHSEFYYQKESVIARDTNFVVGKTYVDGDTKITEIKAVK